MSDLPEDAAPPGATPATDPGTAADARPRWSRVALLLLAGLLVAAALVSAVALRRSGSADESGGPEPTVTLPATPPPDSEAATRHGWRMTEHDEFDGEALDEGLWSPYHGRTTDDVGQHDPDNLSVSDGTLKLTSRGNTSAGMAWHEGQRYGRWEARVRSQAGTGYGPVLLLWPDSEDWSEDGEIDFMEIPKGDRAKAHFTVHWGEDNHQDGASVVSDFTQWHTFAVEWTPDHVIGYVDGEQIYRTDADDANPPGPMHLAIQQDIGPYGDDWIPAPDARTPPTCTFEVDWVRIYEV